MAFDYQAAIDSGYSEDEIVDYLSKNNPGFDVEAARKSDYTPKEIAEYLSSQQKEQSAEKPEEPSAQEPKEEPGLLEKAGRVGSQFALGVAQGSAPGMVYDIATAPLQSSTALKASSRSALFSEIEDLAEKKATGIWSEEEQKELDYLVGIVKNPSRIEEITGKPIDISIKGLTEKATGADLHPHGIAEKAANWIGFIKDPKKIKSLLSWGATPKDLAKAIMPTGKEAFRGAFAGTALEMAEEGQWGPAGTIGAAIVGDIAGHGPMAVWKAILNPKQTAARVTNLLTMNNTRKLAAQQIANDMQKSGLQVDAGTLTGSPIVQMMQARLSQSGLTGDALDNFRKELSEQVVREYKTILEDLGEIKFENDFQAGEAIKDALKTEEQSLNAIPEKSLSERQAVAYGIDPERIVVQNVEEPNKVLLDSISAETEQSTRAKGESLKSTAQEIKSEVKGEFDRRYAEVNEQIANIEAGPQRQLANDLSELIESNRGSLLLGSSAPEARVIEDAIRLLEQLRTPEGGLIGVSLRQLAKTRQTLSDIANWEFHGSNFESAYKKLVGDIDAAIDRSLMNHPELRAARQELNADYRLYKQTFENNNLRQLYEPNNHNYNTIYKDLEKSPDKIHTLEEAIGHTPEGLERVNQVKRDYAQKVIDKPNLTGQDIQDLRSVLGEEFDSSILDYVEARNRPNHLRTPAQQPSLGISPQAIPSAASPISPERVSTTSVPRAAQGQKKKLLEEIANKKPEQIMSQMDTVSGIKRLKQVLSTTPEGRELFKELSRYKMAQLIDKKMTDSVSEQVKLGKFSKLLDTQKTKDIVQELLGKDQFARLQALQKSSGKLAESAAKFFNASKSGTTLVDVGLVGAATTGILTGNAFLAVPAMLKIGGSYVLANLLADPVFLKELQKSISTNNPNKFKAAMKKMSPIVGRAIEKQQTKEGE